MIRSKVAAVGLLVVLVATSGCVGILTGGNTSFTADPVRVAPTTADEVGYSLETNESVNVSRNVSLFGQERTIRVENHVRVYDRSITLPLIGEIEGARFAVVSTPAASAAGQSLNPVARLSTKELILEFSDRFGGVTNVSHVNNRTVRSLGERRTVEKFTGTVERGGQTYDIQAHVLKFKHEGDWIVAGGVHHDSLEEQDNVDELIRSLQHRNGD